MNSLKAMFTKSGDMTDITSDCTIKSESILTMPHNTALEFQPPEMFDLGQQCTRAAAAHPSRWIHKAATSDRNRTPLVVNEDLLNEDKIKGLMLQVTSRLPGIDPTMRVLVLPHMLDGTTMPKMINMDPYRTPTPQQLKLTGLPSVSLCGTPNYLPLDITDNEIELVTLCVPVTLAENSFHGDSTPLLSEVWDIAELCSGNKDTRSLICGPHLEVGPVWQWDKSKVAKLYDVPGSQGFPAQMIDPYWYGFALMPQDVQAYHLHHQRHALRKLLAIRALKVGDGFNIHLNHQGLITAVECGPMSADELRPPPGNVFRYWRT